MLIVREPHKKVVFMLPDGTQFHVAIDGDNKLKVQCASETGAPSLSVEPKADNTICLTSRM
jgi:hypothetical protein